MTIKFLTAFGKYVFGDMDTLSAAEEAGLIAQNIATSNLTGGKQWEDKSYPSTPKLSSIIQSITINQFNTQQFLGTLDKNVQYQITDMKGNPIYAWNSVIFTTPQTYNANGDAVFTQNATTGQSQPILTINTRVLPRISNAIQQTYEAAIVTNGSTLPSLHRQILRAPLARLVKAGVFGKLVELWVPLGSDGDTLAAAVKIKTAQGVSAVLTNTATPTYTEKGGYAFNGSTQNLISAVNPNTAVNPTTGLAMSPSSYGYGVYSLSNTWTGVLAGFANTNYLGYSVANDSKINNVSLGSSISGRLNAIQVDSGFGKVLYGGASFSSTALTGTLPNATLTIGSGAGIFCNASIGGYAMWSTALTSAELQELQIFYDSISSALGRTGFQRSFVGVGDSNTVGTGTGVTTSNRFSALVAGVYGLTDDNSGIGNWAMSNATTIAGSSGAFVVSRLHVGTIKKAGALYTVMLGTNDDRFGVPYANFIADYETWLSYQFAAGIDPSQFLLLGIPAAYDAASSATRQQQFNLGIKNLAFKYGCGFLDTWPLFPQNTTYFQVADQLHLTTTSHAVLSAAIQAYAANQQITGTWN